MKIAVITPRVGLSKYQVKAFTNLLKHFNPEKDTFIIGGDKPDISIYNILTTGRWKMILFPHNSIDHDFQFDGVEMMEVRNFSERNKAMVDACDEVIAIVQMVNENEDSPCWKTIRYADAIRKEIRLISPAGWTYVRE